MEFVEVRDVINLLAYAGDLNPNIEIRVCFALVKKGVELLDKASIVITELHS